MRFDDQRTKTYFADYGRACGKRLQQWRRTRRMTQEQLAEIAGVTQQMVSFAEGGIRTPKIDTRMRICAALAVEHDDIWPAPDRIHFAQAVVAA